MTNSHEVINLETMAQCLADARHLLRDGDMCADTYVSLLEEAARQIRSVLAFVQDVGLELIDEDKKETDALLSHCKVVEDYRKSSCFQGGDFDLYLDLQNPGCDPTLVRESEVIAGPYGYTALTLDPRDPQVRKNFPGLFDSKWGAL
jgi:hypothetical protein